MYFKADIYFQSAYYVVHTQFIYQTLICAARSYLCLSFVRGQSDSKIPNVAKHSQERQSSQFTLYILHVRRTDIYVVCLNANR